MISNFIGSRTSDIDECMEATPCAANATCTNTHGSYDCACNDGYRGDGYSQCLDIDECVENISMCDTNANCTNTQGSYLCDCIEGYRGDGFNCSGTIHGLNLYQKKIKKLKYHDKLKN